MWPACRRLAKEAFEHFGYWRSGELCDQVFLNGMKPRKGLEHLGAVLKIKVHDCFHGHSPAKARGNDGACACAGEEVEVVAENEGPSSLWILLLVMFAQQLLDLEEDLEGEDAAYAATIQSKNSFHGVNPPCL